MPLLLKSKSCCGPFAFVAHLVLTHSLSHCSRRYGGDSIFGGLSSAVTVLVKAIVKKSLKDVRAAKLS